jgi:hypothetical protein
MQRERFTSLPAAEIQQAPQAIANLNGDYLEGIAQSQVE